MPSSRPLDASRRSPWTTALVLLLPALGSLACTDPEGDSPGLAEHPCAEAWALQDDDAMFVDASATDPEAVGTVDQPMASMHGALDRAIEQGIWTVALGPGDYSADPERGRFLLDSSFSGMRLVGCGAGETRLVAIEAVYQGAPVGTEPVLQSVIEVDAGAQGVELRGLTLSGGRSALLVHDGAGSEQPVVVEDVVVEDSVRAGLLYAGLTTRVRTVDVRVDGVLPDADGGHGWGVAVIGGGSVFNEPSGLFEFEGLQVEGATGAGIVIDHAVATLEDVEVRGTQTTGGVLGRGIHVQNNATVELTGVLSTGNWDAALFLHKPVSVLVRDSIFEATELGSVPGHPDALTGDGLVATGGSEPDELPVDVTGRRVELHGCTFAGNARAGALLEGVTAVVGEGNVFEGNGLSGNDDTFPLGPDVDTLYLQGDAVLEGPDGGAPGLEGQLLGGDSGFQALDLHRSALGLDEPAQ